MDVKDEIINGRLSMKYKEYLCGTIERVFNKYKNIKYEGINFKDKNINVTVVDEDWVTCNADIIILKDSIEIGFYMNAIRNTIREYDLQLELFIEYLLFHEFAHFYAYSEELPKYGEGYHRMLIQVCNSNSAIFHKCGRYLSLNAIQIESFCDAIALEMMLEFSDSFNHYSAIDKIGKYINSYFNRIIKKEIIEGRQSNMMQSLKEKEKIVPFTFD